MSTKIFPHRPRKLKPPKPPPDIDGLFERMTAQHQERLAKKAEERRIMAELRAEELDKRAAHLPPSITKKDHCPNCWARRVAMEMLTRDRKLLWRMYRGVRMKRAALIEKGWREKRQVAMYLRMAKRAELEKVAASEDHIARAIVVSWEIAMDELKHPTPEKKT